MFISIYATGQRVAGLKVLEQHKNGKSFRTAQKRKTKTCWVGALILNQGTRAL